MKFLLNCLGGSELSKPHIPGPAFEHAGLGVQCGAREHQSVPDVVGDPWREAAGTDLCCICGQGAQSPGEEQKGDLRLGAHRPDPMRSLLLWSPTLSLGPLAALYLVDHRGHLLSG